MTNDEQRSNDDLMNSAGTRWHITSDVMSLVRDLMILRINNVGRSDLDSDYFGDEMLADFYRKRDNIKKHIDANSRKDEMRRALTKALPMIYTHSYLSLFPSQTIDISGAAMMMDALEGIEPPEDIDTLLTAGIGLLIPPEKPPAGES